MEYNWFMFVKYFVIFKKYLCSRLLRGRGRNQLSFPWERPPLAAPSSTFHKGQIPNEFRQTLRQNVFIYKLK